jgi:hypothetical protein
MTKGGSSMPRDPDRIPVMMRVPADMDRWLRARAAYTTASIASECVRIIRAAMDAEQRQQRAERKREAAHG